MLSLPPPLSAGFGAAVMRAGHELCFAMYTCECVCVHRRDFGLTYSCSNGPIMAHALSLVVLVHVCTRCLMLYERVTWDVYCRTPVGLGPLSFRGVLRRR